MKTTIRDVLAQKGDSTVFSVDPQELVIRALRLMSDCNIGALLVLENKDQIVGIVTERDYSRKVVLAGRSSSTTKVREIMDECVLFLVPEDPVDAVMALMTEKRLRHLPVLQHGRLIGLISMGDIVKAVISQNQFMIDQLTRYIVGSYTDNVLQFPSASYIAEERLIAP